MPVKLQTFRPTLLSGQVYMREYGAQAPRIPVGNVSLLDLATTEEKKTLVDHTKPGGGTWAAIPRVSGVALKAKLHDLDPVNLARVLYGEVIEQIAGTVADEPVVAYQGGLIRLAHPNPSGLSVAWGGSAWAASTDYALGAVLVVGGRRYSCTTAGASGASAPTWPTTTGETVTDGAAVWTDVGAWVPAPNVDYEVRKEGLFVLGGVIADQDPLLLGYSYGVYSVVEALVGSSKVWEVSFGGLNEANGESPVVVDVYRWQAGAAKSLGLLGGDFAGVEIEGEVLKDVTKTGSGTSPYFRVQMV